MPGRNETSYPDIQLSQWSPDLQEVQAQGEQVHSLQGGVHGEGHSCRANDQRYGGIVIEH